MGGSGGLLLQHTGAVVSQPLDLRDFSGISLGISVVLLLRRFLALCGREGKSAEGSQAFPKAANARGQNQTRRRWLVVVSPEGSPCCHPESPAAGFWVAALLPAHAEAAQGTWDAATYVRGQLLPLDSVRPCLGFPCSCRSSSSPFWLPKPPAHGAAAGWESPEPSALPWGGNIEFSEPPMPRP